MIDARRAAITVLSLILVSGCQTDGNADPVPAVLQQADETSLRQLESVLADALGRASVELGAGDVTESSVVVVLPPPLGPLEGNSPAAPELFDLVTYNGDCFVVSQDTGEQFELAGLACRPL